MVDNEIETIAEENKTPKEVPKKLPKETPKNVPKKEAPKKVSKADSKQKDAPESTAPAESGASGGDGSAIKIKMYGKYDCSEVRVSDEGLREYINTRSMYIPFSSVRHTKKRFWKKKLHIVERLINKLAVAGHCGPGSKHLFTSGRNTGKKTMLSNAVEDAFSKIHKRTKKNPVQVLVNAIENIAPKGEVTSVTFGGVKRPVAVDTAPQRRVDVSLSLLSKGVFNKSHGNRNSLSQILAEELVLAAENDPKSFAIEKRINIERQAEASK